MNSEKESLRESRPYTVEDTGGDLPERGLFPAPMSEVADVLPDIRIVEARYEIENRLILAVSQGRDQEARRLLESFDGTVWEQRSSDPLRDTRNYAIIMNTLLRKAAEGGGVHPLYIDRVSSDFARRIEVAGREELLLLWQEMVYAYCLLVKKHATSQYSPLVQKVVARVDFNLAEDLSLRANAEALNVSPSYLSTLFRRETGQTITEYVNRKRMEHAAFLLFTTKLPVSAVGQRCGVQDDNYFTKIFKKYTGQTPKQYRQEVRQR